MRREIEDPDHREFIVVGPLQILCFEFPKVVP
jgi:hypothetical protein